MDSAVIIGRAAAQKEAQQNVALRRSNNWQDECDEIRADMGRRRRRILRRRRMLLLAVVLVPAYVGAGGWWLMKSGYVPQLSSQINSWAVQQAWRAGFALKQVRIEGMKQLGADQVMQAAGLSLDMPMLALSLAQVHDRIAALPQVREVKLRRQFPDTLYITVTERQKAALWLHEGVLHWIDRDGTVLSDVAAGDERGVLHVLGKGAPKHISALLVQLEAHPYLSEHISSVRWVGERRWDLVMKGGLLVKLPQESFATALDKLASLYAHQDLARRAIRMLDLRFDDRMFVLPEAQDGQAVGGGSATPYAPSAPQPAPAMRSGADHEA